MSDKVVNLLERALNSRGKKLTKPNEYMFYSPFVSHYKPKLQINVSTQKWHCWVSNMGGHSIYSLFKKLNVSRELYGELKDIFFVPESTDIQKSEVVVLPKEYKPLWIPMKSLYRSHALKFLTDRGITEYDIKKYKIGFCEDGLYQHRIIVPSHSEDETINYFVGRSYMGSGMKYKNPNVSKDVIGFDYHIAWSKPIILCEGVFDAIAIKRNAIPLFGKTIPKSLKKKIYEKKVKKIYILLDKDAISDAIKITDDLMKNGIDVYFVSLSEEDPSDMGFKKVINLIKETKQTFFSDLMRMKLNGKTRKYLEI